MESTITLDYDERILVPIFLIRDTFENKVKRAYRMINITEKPLNT